MWFSTKRKTNTIALAVADDISVHAAYGSNRFKEIYIKLVGSINLEQLLIAFMEFNIFLLHITDKLSSNYYGTIQRNDIINKVINQVKINFCNSQVFNDVLVEKQVFFEDYFKESFYSYPMQSSILGIDEEQVVLFFSERLVNLFLNDKIESQRNYVKAIISEMLSSYVLEFLSLKSIKKLLT